MNWHGYADENAKLPLRPYEINCGRETITETDVLVVGGGFAKYSGQGGVGVDHWRGAARNPYSQITPEMYFEKP